jgi:hypothetical protein
MGRIYFNCDHLIRQISQKTQGQTVNEPPSIVGCSMHCGKSLNSACSLPVTKAGCLRSAVLSQSVRPLVAWPSPTQPQRRTQTTQIQPPKIPNAANAASAKNSEPSDPATKKITKKVKWSKVDFDAIQIPEHKNPEPVLHVENGKTYYKHPRR